jgi:hypothetical protein
MTGEVKAPAQKTGLAAQELGIRDAFLCKAEGDARLAANSQQAIQSARISTALFPPMFT